MSTVIYNRSETSGATHLRCPTCGQLSNSHVTQLSHVADAHPTCLDDLTFGRLGNIIMYQSGAKLFHCAACFYTCRDFSSLYRHLISTHCMDQSAGSVTDTVKIEEEAVVDESGGEKECGIEVDDIADRVEKKEGRPEEAALGLHMEDGGAKASEESEKTGEECSSAGLKVDLTQHEGERSDLKREAEGETSAACQVEGVNDGGEEPTKIKSSEDEGGESPVEGVLAWSKGRYHCLRCGWKNKLKAVSVSHIVRKHNIPKAFASNVVRRDEEDEESTALSGELLKEEMKAVSRVVSILSQHFVCRICGWTTKRKGLAVSHVDRSHEVERPYRCRDCNLAFFLPSRLQQHMASAHRPGCYACPFCCFRSHYLGGFKRHCSRCNFREEDEGVGGAVQGQAVDREEAEVKEIRAGGRVRRPKVMAGEEQGDEGTRDSLS
ncbi:uncharacterized protein ACB058_004450 [Synchiropus picturatus]